MTKDKKITVLLSVYNTEFSIVKRAIDSVLAQDYQNFELIIIDDGSDVCYQTPLLEYASLHESNVTYFRHSNRGQSQSINRGIGLSNSEYITIIDADDEFKSNHLSSCLREMQNVDLIASTTNTIVENDADYFVPDKNDLSQLIHIDDCVLFATLFGKREVFDNADFLDIYSADSEFYENASKSFQVKKVNLRTYVYYRNNVNSTCSKMKLEQQLATS